MRQAQGATSETEALEGQIADMEQRIEAIKQRYPTLDEDLKAFAAEDSTLPDALTVFRTLAANARRWSQIRVPVIQSQELLRFKRALDEMAAVREEEAGKCAQAIAAWLEPRRNMHAQLQTL